MSLDDERVTAREYQLREQEHEYHLREAAESVEAMESVWVGSFRQQADHWTASQHWDDQPRLHADRVADGLVADDEPAVVL